MHPRHSHSVPVFCFIVSTGLLFTLSYTCSNTLACLYMAGHVLAHIGAINHKICPGRLWFQEHSRYLDIGNQSSTCWPSSRRYSPYQWRYNERHGVSNHRRLDSLLNCLFRHRSKKTSKLCDTGPLWGESTGDRWIPLTKGQQRGKCFHLMTSCRTHRHVSIIWTNAGILLIGPLETNYNEILIEIHTFS